MNGTDAITLKQYFETLMEQYKQAHAREHVLLAESVEQTKENLELRLESMNQFRAQILSERGTMVTLEKFDSKMSEIDKVNKLKTESDNIRIGTMETQLANFKGRITTIGGCITIGLIILELILRFVVKI
jgi:hypothetical protein